MSRQRRAWTRMVITQDELLSCSVESVFILKLANRLLHAVLIHIAMQIVKLVFSKYPIFAQGSRQRKFTVRLTVRGKEEGSAPTALIVNKCEHFNPIKTPSKDLKQYFGTKNTCFLPDRKGGGVNPQIFAKTKNARLTNNCPHPTKMWGVRGDGGDGMSGRLCPNIGCITASIWPSLVNIFATACVCANHETSCCDLCKQLMCTLLCQSQTCSFMTLLPPDRAQPLRSDR